MLPRRHLITLAVSFASILLVAGCGGASKKSDGGGGGDDGPRQIDERDLDTGSASLDPSEVDADTGNDIPNARAVEAHRIANVVVDPNAVDPRFQIGTSLNGRMASASELTAMFASEDPKLIATRVSGGVASRRFDEAGSEPTSVNNVVLSFDTAAAAAAFVKRIADKNETSGVDPIFGQPFAGTRTTIAGHPKARAALYRVGRDDRDPSLQVLEAQDRMVIYLFMGGPGAKLAQTKGLAAKLLTAQKEALEDFEPVRLLELRDLEIDPSGVAELTMDGGDARKEKNDPNIVRVWNRNGALHQQTWAGDLAEAFERADMDVMAQGRSNVYRTGSAKQAARLLKDFDDAVTAKQYRAFNSPKGLREARCYELLDKDSTVYVPNFCMVQYGRYVAEAGGATADDAEDAISAQYLILQEAKGSDD